MFVCLFLFLVVCLFVCLFVYLFIYKSPNALNILLLQMFLLHTPLGYSVTRKHILFNLITTLHSPSQEVMYMMTHKCDWTTCNICE